MPFRIQTNNSSLELVWSNNDKDGIDVQELKDIYTSIDIQGDSNYLDYQILNRYTRSEVLQITDCTIDLSNIQGHMNHVSLIQCQCINDFPKECIITDLNIEDSRIQTQQLQNLEISFLNVTITSLSIFDFYNSNQLKCKLNKLSFTGQTVDLSTLSGEWTQISFNDCEFIGEVDNKRLKVLNVRLKITESRYKNNLSCLESLKCNSFNISQVKHEEYYKIDIVMPNDNKNKKYMTAILNMCICDLNCIRGPWATIEFNNCIFEVKQMEYRNIFANTTIKVILDNTCPIVNYAALCGLKCNLTISLNNILVDFNQVRKCKPEQLILRQCSFNIEELVGTWRTLNMYYCQIQGSEQILPKSIKAQKMVIYDIKSDLCRFFDTKSLTLFKAGSITQFPDTSKLCLIYSTLSTSDVNNNIKYLSLLNVKLVKFSILSFPKLIGIDLNYFSFNKEQNIIRTAIIEYIRFKKKSTNALKQRLHRIRYQESRIQIKRTRIQKEYECFNHLLCEPLQFLSGQFPE
ncbi:Hypothetical_protein [Hexamita inflata]|uniref:Hypothetical_protein n=1 Tax=Hexamita inflata TaxID=28002 RepID=A0AA86RSH3_9EUKA|nr:Hypothetical protein HINF_LOCUS59395 [Hexamita inflata]